jgi:hypothetical protein
MNGLDSYFVYELANFCIEKFLNVIPCNMLKDYKLEPNQSIIVNLSPSWTIGSHYVAIFARKNHIIYFDSFGLDCFNKDIHEELKKYNQDIIHSNKQIQSFLSFHCGFYCIHFLICMERQQSFKTYLNMFQDVKLKENDQFVVNMIKKYVKEINKPKRYFLFHLFLSIFEIHQYYFLQQ